MKEVMMAGALRPRLRTMMLAIAFSAAVLGVVLGYRRFDQCRKALNLARLSVDYWSKVVAFNRRNLERYETLPPAQKVELAGSAATWEGYRKRCRDEIEADSRLLEYYSTVRRKNALAIRHPWDHLEPDPPPPPDPPRVYALQVYKATKGLQPRE